MSPGKSGCSRVPLILTEISCCSRKELPPGRGEMLMAQSIPHPAPGVCHFFVWNLQMPHSWAKNVFKCPPWDEIKGMFPLNLKASSWLLVCYTAVFSVVTPLSTLKFFVSWNLGRVLTNFTHNSFKALWQKKTIKMATSTDMKGNVVKMEVDCSDTVDKRIPECEALAAVS